MARKRFLIVGDGAAGLTAAEQIRRSDRESAIGVLCDDPNPGYFRAALTNFLLGELREDQLWAVAPDFYESHRIERVQTRVLRVDAGKREVWCSGNPAPLGYDALLIASGARARPPSFPGGHLPGVLTLRTIQDARRVVDALRGGVRRAVVLGGGALGLEWTHALLERGVHVTLVERAPRFMPAALDGVASDLLSARLRKAGVEVVLGDEAAHAEPSASGAVGAIVTRGGRRLPCELVAAALGVVPNSEVVEHSTIERTSSGAVRVDRALRTSAAQVWAAGDVASVEGEQLGLWAPARDQGRVAGANMCGAAEEYRPGAHYFATRLFDLDFASIGASASGPAGQELVDFPRGTGSIAYRKLLVEAGRVKGALLLGERQAKVRTIGRGLKRLIDTGADVSGVAGRLLEPSFDVAGFLETQRLLERPAAAARLTHVAPVAPAAKLRGTQAVSLSAALSGLKQRAGTAVLDSDALEALAAAPGTAVLPVSQASAAVSTAELPSRTSALPTSTPRSSTRMLSIGLHAEAPPAVVASDTPIEAAFELAGQSIPLRGKLCSIGSGPDATLRLADPAVAFLHAQVMQHGRALYVRDAGTQTGTWVNGVPLANAHALTDGDRVVVGRTELVLRARCLAKERTGAMPVIALPRLELRSGPGMGLSFVLASEHCTIGSGAHAQLQIFDPSVAPLHARVRTVHGLHYLSDAESASGTYLRGGRLPPGQEVVLGDGEVFQVGAVAVAYTRAPTTDRLAAFRPTARLAVMSGAGAGLACSFHERALLGASADAQLRLPAGTAHEVEIVLHQGAWFVRDLSGGRTFRNGTPLGPEWSPITSGELLLLSSGALVRFEGA